MTADALVAELRELGLGAEPDGDWVRVTIAGLPLTPLLIIPAPRPDIPAPPPGTRLLDRAPQERAPPDHN
jgi:hypothetical protein